MRNRSTDEDSNRGAQNEIRGSNAGGRGNRWEQSRFDQRPTAGDAGWAEPPHDVRHQPGLKDAARANPDAGQRGDGRPRTQQAFTGKGPRTYVRSDERIREDAYDALTYQSALDASDLEISVENGELTLSGTVASREEKRAAEDLCAHVRGVKDVHNRIRIARSPQDTNPERDANTDGTAAQQKR